MTKMTVIGGGNMGTAIVKAVISQNIISQENITIIENFPERQEFLKSELDCNIQAEIDSSISDQDVIMVAIKPQSTDQVLSLLKGKLNQKQLIISIMAGIKIQTLEDYLAPAQIVRVMPNMPSAIGYGMATFCGGKTVTEESFKLAEAILNATGKSFKVEKEEMIDSTTAISGSGPAYVFYFAEAMTEGAKQLGFNDEEAQLLAKQTLLGAAQLLEQTGTPAGTLREQVTSKGGTTAAALNSFAENKIAELLQEGFKAAFDRSIELGKN